jgi:hypothetical protein
VGVSELRYGRTVRVVVSSGKDVSVVKILYDIKCTNGVRVVGGRYGNAVEEEVVRLALQCEDANGAAA